MWIALVGGLVAVAAVVVLAVRLWAGSDQPGIVQPVTPEPAKVSEPPEPIQIAPMPRPVPIGMAQMTEREARELQKTWGEHLGVPVVIENSIGMKLVLIPPVMSTKTGARPQVLSGPYRLGMYEVTRAQFHQFVNATRYVTSAEAANLLRLPPIPVIAPEPKRDFDWRNPGVDATASDHPVVWVSWLDAMAFCRWLSEKEKRTYRLPTVAEWNWACRGGDQFPRTHGWSSADSGGRPHRGGKLKPTRWGLYDMFGNVHEPVMDRSGTVAPNYRPETDLTENVYRLTHGGSFRFHPKHVTFSYTSSENFGGRGMTAASDDSGFRVYCEQ
ncbi:MAG: formylglycine-generating enzyme family protein [Planctomycetia bacterium]|nr:formylglycine-generating enzyme family protein [Planctomycetia bacterium]